LIAELAMFADDLVVVGAGRLLAAEPVRTTLARGGAAVTVRTPDMARLARLLTGHGITVQIDGDRLSVHGVGTAVVSQLAFDHRIQVTEITETSRSLEEILIDMTGASAEFAAA
jgi:ABC-2 type transport system ATP-binding protein